MIPLHAPRKILVIKLRALGDTLLMTVPLRALHEAYPSAQIDVAVTQAWAPLIEGQAGVKKIWGYERHKSPAARAKAVGRLALKLRRERYDWVINLHASPSSATISFATGAPVRSIHFHGHGDKNRYSTLEVPGKGVLKPIIERDLDTVRATGIEVESGLLPEVLLTTNEKADARVELRAMGLTEPVLAMGVSSSRPTKSWPMERYSELAMKWIKETGGSVFVPLASNEGALSEFFIQGVSEEFRSKAWVPMGLPLRKFGALLSQCKKFVGNDSGPKHLAVSVGTPTLTLFGPEDPFEWHPYPRTKHPILYQEGLSCRKDADPGMPPWCGISVCTVERHRCMKEFTVAQVFDALAAGALK